MPELLAVGLEATAVVLAISAACVVAGYGLTRRLAPPDLRATGFLLVPLVGAAALIVGAYALNLIMDLRIATALLLGAGAALAAWTVRRDGWWLPRPTKPQSVTLVAGGLLLGSGLPPAPARTVGRDVGTEHRRRPVRAPGRGPEVEHRLHARAGRGPVPGRIPGVCPITPAAGGFRIS